MKNFIICDGLDCKWGSWINHKYGYPLNTDIFTEPDSCDQFEENIRKLLSFYQNTELVSMHGPYKDLCMGSKDKLIKAATMQRFQSAYEIAKKINCSNIILHHGYIPGTSIPKYWVKRTKNFWDEFLKDKDDNVCYYLENQFEHSPELLLEVVNAVNDHRVGICLDVGHANCNSRTPVMEWISQCNSKINFVHLHNNNGFQDQHLGIHNGTMDFRQVCDALEKYAPDAVWALEVNSPEDAEQSVRWLMDNGFLKSSKKPDARRCGSEENRNSNCGQKNGNLPSGASGYFL